VNGREISLSFGTMLLVLCLLTQQCSMSKGINRIADQGDAMLCIEAAKAGAQLQGQIADQCSAKVKK